LDNRLDREELMGKSVLIVDDSLFIRKILRGILEDNSYQVIGEAASGIDAMKKLHFDKPDIILLDIILPDSNGLDLLESILKTNPHSQIVICSSIGTEQLIHKTLDLGAKAFIQKPFTPEQVVEVLSRLES
jgi:two-component system chemotaxis response regulator CheY